MITKLSQNEDFTIVTKGGGKIIVPNVVTEPQFNPTAAYAVDAKVWYGSIQYVCTTATTKPAEGQSNPTPKEDTTHWSALPTEEMAKKSEVDTLMPLLFSQYYPEGNVKSTAEFTAGIKYDDPDTTNRTIMVKPFCNIDGTVENDNSNLSGRVVIPPFVDASGNGYISDDGTRYKVVGVGSGTDSNNSNENLTAVIAPSTVANIKDKAFRRCTKLASVSITAATSIGSGAFNTCTSLASVSLPAVDSIGTYAFNSCTKLASVSITAATNIQNYAFYSCTKLTSVSIPAAKSIGGHVFDGCTKLASVSLPAATSVGGSAFNNCNSLASVSLPVVTSIDGYSFAGCTSLTSVDFGETLSSAPTLGSNAFSSVPTSCKIIVPDAQYDAWIAASGWSSLVTKGYKFLKHSEWEYARKYELDSKLDKSGGTVVGTLGVAGPEWPEQKVFEVTPSADGSEPTMRFTDCAGVIGITWHIVDGYVVMDVSDLLGHTYRISLPPADGTIALLQNLAGDFSSSTTYAKDALVVYSGTLYHCVNTNGHTGEWVDADFTPATVEDVLTSLRQGKLDTSGGTMTGKFQVGAHNDGSFHVVPEKFDQGSYIPPTMRFGDEAGVVGITWSIDMDGVVMDVSEPYGHTYHVAMPTASGTLALTAGKGHAGNLVTLDDNGNPINSGTAASSILNQTAVENEFSELSTYAQKDYATHDGRLYRCKNTNGPGQWDPLYWENVKIKDLLDEKLGKNDTIKRLANDNNTEHCDGSGNVYDVTKSGNTWYVPNGGGNQTYYGIFDSKYAWTHGGSFMTTYDPTTGIVKLYSGATFQIPKNLNPLLGDDLSVDDENIIFTPLQATESSAPKTKFVRFPVYNGQNQQYFDDTATDEDDPTKTYKDTGTHRWTATASCIAYFNMQGSPNQNVVRIVVNDKSEVDSTTVFTHTVYRNLNLANKCVCVPLFLNANDKVYVKVDNNPLSSFTISVFYT